VNLRFQDLDPIRADVRTRTVAVGIGIVVCVLSAGWYWLAHRNAGPPKAPPAVAVNVATVTRGDVPMYLEGLGTVQAFYTVTVTARVDGRIDKVAFREGQDVKKGALLVQIDPRPYQAALGVAIATRDKDRAQLENARRDMERYDLLAPEDLASKQTVDTQKALIAQLIAQVKGDEAAIDSARTNLDYTTITSPIDGRTGIRLVDPGNNVHATDTTGMVVVTQLEPISIIFSLPEEDFAQLQGALGRGEVTATALSRDDKAVLDAGTVALIDNQIDQTTGTIRVKATLPNKQRKLWPGEFVNVRVQTQMRRQVLTVPASALQRGPDGLFTYTVQADSTISATPVTAAEPVGDVVVVENGLNVGQQVVTSNFYRLQPGTHIRANTPAGTPANAGTPGGAEAPAGAAAQTRAPKLGRTGGSAAAEPAP
jgi:membrane fusion protein, multidrug efflux system